MTTPNFREADIPTQAVPSDVSEAGLAQRAEQMGGYSAPLRAVLVTIADHVVAAGGSFPAINGGERMVRGLLASAKE